MNEQETTTDIIAEIRELSNPISDGIIAINGKSIADRLDAAHKRERGDSAKQREALKDIVRIVEQIRLLYSDFPYEIHDIARKARAALAAPPRNCDVYSHDEALNIWAAEKENERNGCFDEWLYHEATEKEGDEK